MTSGWNKSKLIRLNLAMSPNLELLLRMKKSKIVNIKVNPSYNMHLILKFYVGLRYIRAVSSAVLQKWGIGAKFWWWEFRWVGHHLGCRRAGTLPSMAGGGGIKINGDLVISGGLIPLCTLWCCKYFFLLSSHMSDMCTFLLDILCFYGT